MFSGDDADEGYVGVELPEYACKYCHLDELDINEISRALLHCTYIRDHYRRFSFFP